MEGLWGLVNNAAVGGARGRPEWLKTDDFREVNETNLYGLIDLTTTLLPLIKRERGRVVNISSLAGRMVLPFAIPYSVSKFAVECLTDVWRFLIFLFFLHFTLSFTFYTIIYILQYRLNLHYQLYFTLSITFTQSLILQYHLHFTLSITFTFFTRSFTFYCIILMLRYHLHFAVGLSFEFTLSVTFYTINYIYTIIYIIQYHLHFTLSFTFYTIIYILHYYLHFT